jgi:hypothetical protein
MRCAQAMCAKGRLDRFLRFYMMCHVRICEIMAHSPDHDHPIMKYVVVPTLVTKKVAPGYNLVRHY